MNNLVSSLIACVPKFNGIGDDVEKIINQCDLCKLLATIQNVIDFMFKLAIPVGAVAIIIGGFFIMTAGDSEKRYTQGKDALKAAIIGILITLSSWMILNSFMAITPAGGGASTPPGGSETTPPGGVNIISPGGAVNTPK